MFVFTAKEFDKVWDYLSDNLFCDRNISSMISQCEKYGHIWLVGGSIKDIAFLNRKPRDFDLVVKTSSDFKLDLPECFTVGINSFGSYKIKYKDFEFDIWSFKDQNDFFDKTTQLNIDGLYLNLSTGRYNAKIYNEAIREGIVKEINTKNNHPLSHKTTERLHKYAEKLNLIIQ